MHTDSLLINALYYLLAAVIAVPFFKWVLVARVGHIDATVRMNPDIIGTIKGFSLIAVGDHRVFPLPSIFTSRCASFRRSISLRLGLI